MRDFFTDCGTWGIMEGDCLERLQELPEGCADLVLIDPPYGTIKGLDANRAAQLLGNRSAEHAFCFDSSQFANCSQATYARLVELVGLDQVDGFLPWEEVARIDAEFKTQTAPTFHLPEGKGHRGNVLEFAKEAKSYHPTQKPVALLVEILETFTNPGDLVVDFTMGSGSTGVACLKTGRRFVGVEKAQKYFETAQRRISTAWEEST